MKGKKKYFHSLSLSVLRILTESKAKWELEMWEKAPKHREISAIEMLQ